MKNNTVNLKDWLETLYPHIPAGSDVIDGILLWPPDVFALTHQLLSNTGAYRYVVQPYEEWPKSEKDWKDELERQSVQWYETLSSGSAPHNLPEILKFFKETIKAQYYVNLPDFLKKLIDDDQNSTDDEKSNNWKLRKAILSAHVLADHACQDFGMPLGEALQILSHPSHQPIATKALTPIQYHNRAFIHFLANLLLAESGSLACWPRQQIKVFPKLRTPAIGMTIRSLSHYLTAHQTEINVNWRTLPLVNVDEDTLNILVVPWPFEVGPKNFKPSGHVISRTSRDKSRYFEYETQSFDPEFLRRMLDQAEIHVSRIHMIIFPELALSKDNYVAVQSMLHDRFYNHGEKSPKSPPILIAGVQYKGNDEPIATQRLHPDDKSKDPKENSGENLTKNTVVISSFFAGKWYSITQPKHHRWKLDRSQIRQYNLAGKLPAAKNWWEATPISRRELTILAPSSWFALAPLICEDLARQEPVSEVIRGIGPTLVVALLLDGPQMSARWPGRYASVLADDPGSSVLSVSALGMVQLSTPANNTSTSKKSQSIILWKDNATGAARELELWTTDSKKPTGIVISATAQWEEEVTSDGRGDGDNAAIFAIEGQHSLPESPIIYPKTDEKNDAEKKPISAVSASAVSASAEDIAEINIFTYFADAVIDLPKPYIEKLSKCVKLRSVPNPLPMDTECNMSLPSLNNPTTNKVLNRVRSRRREIMSGKIDNGNNELDMYIHWFSNLMCYFNRDLKSEGTSENTLDLAITRYRNITNDATLILKTVQDENFIDDMIAGFPFKDISNFELQTALREFDPKMAVSECIRVSIYGPLVLLWAIHARLSWRRSFDTLGQVGTKLLKEIETILLRPHHGTWLKAKEKKECNQKWEGSK